MATSAQLKTRLKEKRLAAFWKVDQARGFTGTYEEWLEGAEPYIDEFSQADAEAIFAFLTIDIRVKSGIALSVDSGIGLGVGYPIPVAVDPVTHIGGTTANGSGATSESGPGATTEQGYLE